MAGCILTRPTLALLGGLKVALPSERTLLGSCADVEYARVQADLVAILG